MIKIRIKNSYGKIGRAYVLNVMGAVPAHDEDNPNYTIIGRDLIRRGLAEITEKGVLIYDHPSDELAEVYDGHTFPRYYYDNTLVSVVASYNGRSELLQLPGEELAIEKALSRLGAQSDQACEITMEFHSVNNATWAQRILDIMNEEGLYAGNRMLYSLNYGDMDWDKLSAVIELANAHTAENIAYLADHRDDFEFIPGVACVEDIGHYFVENESEHHLDLEMRDYFDFSAFGEYICKGYNGRFVSGGYVYGSGGQSLDELVDGLEQRKKALEWEECKHENQWNHRK